jgi:tRNA G18 (ribose-2'-O)-methylase SpoU
VETGGLRYEIRQCCAETCRFRFPAVVGQETAALCPQCQAVTAVVVASPVHPSEPNKPKSPSLTPIQLEILLDNIRSLYNVGSIFRTADGAGVRQLHLAGITATPDNPKLTKTALGAASQMRWQYHLNGLDTAVALQKQGMRLWALEETPTAEPLFESEIVNDGRAVLLIVGNENIGVDPAILQLCERTFSLPMLGLKDSLNVAVAFGIALYHLRFSNWVIKSNH